MKKALLYIGILLAVLLFIVPIPYTVKDGGSVCLSPIVPIYEVYIYNADWDGNQTMKGWSIDLLGMEVYENTYFVDKA